MRVVFWIPALSIAAVVLLAGMLIADRIAAGNDDTNELLISAMRACGMIMLPISLAAGIASFGLLLKHGRGAGESLQIWMFTGAALPCVAVLILCGSVFHELSHSNWGH